MNVNLTLSIFHSNYHCGHAGKGEGGRDGWREGGRDGWREGGLWLYMSNCHFVTEEECVLYNQSVFLSPSPVLLAGMAGDILLKLGN